MNNSIKRNSIYNFFGQIIPAICLFISIPFLVKNLGAEIYGIFAIIILIVDYFSFFDIGLSGAVTKFISEAIGKNEQEKIYSIYKKTFLLSIIFSSFAALLYLSLVPYLSRYFLNINQHNRSDIQNIFRASSLIVFFVVLKCFFRGILEAYRRFDIINTIMVPIFSLAQVFYVVAVLNGKGLLALVLLLSAREAVVCFFYFIFSRKIILNKSQIQIISWREIWKLIKYGSHLSVTRTIGWIMSSFDKFLISSVLTTSAVTYYVVPYGVATKIAIIAGCIAPIIFPVSSELHASNKQALVDFFKKSLGYSLILMALPTLLLVIFARDILLFWVGPDFMQSVLVLQLLAIGAFFSALSWIFGTLIQGTGHPKLVTIWGVALLPVELLTMYFLMKNIGLIGAAISWMTMRCITVVVFFFFVERYLKLIDWSLFKDKRIFHIVFFILVSCAVSIFLRSVLHHSLISLLVNITLFTTFYFAIIAWKISGVRRLLNPNSFFVRREES